jgi:hypothetical protein
MGQKAFINYKDEILSFPLVEKHMGIFKPGRYSGFNELATVNDLIITLNHSAKGKKTLANGDQVINFGSFITPNGTVIHQEGGIDLTIANNASNANTRTDYIVADHTFEEIQGGSQATFSIIQGPNGGEEPTLSDDSVQVLLAKITIKPYGSAFIDLTLIEVQTPSLGATTPQQAYGYIEALINSGLPVSSKTIRGIVRLATEEEATLGTNQDKAITPSTLFVVLNAAAFVSDENYVHTDNNLTETLLNKIGVQSDWDESSSNNTGYIKNKPNIISIVTSGEIATSNRITGTTDNSSNWGFNYAHILPPSGKSMVDCLGVIASISKIQVDGKGHNGNIDYILWCRSRKTNNSYIEIIAQSNENKINSIVNYLAIWK